MAQENPKDVFLFIPNIIGYGRILLALVSFYYMPTNHVLASFLYIVSGLLDAVDGHAARYFKQSSKYGAMLDMLTDRCATMCLLMTLSCFYPRWMFFFQLSSTIDIASHWLHMYSSNISGSSSHKAIDLSGNPLLRLYYTSRPVLFCMCTGNELFYCMLYLLYFTYGPIVNLLLFSFSLWKFLCILCFPVAVVKSGISLVHLVTAAQTVALIDVSDRRKAAGQKIG